jgi:hypothetical protein
MNRNIASAVVLAAAALAGNAFADDITIDPAGFTASRGRAEVQAELAQFKQSGVNPWSIAHNPLRGFQAGKTRAQVEGEYLAARDEVAAMTREDSGSGLIARRTHAGAPVAASQTRAAL